MGLDILAFGLGGLMLLIAIIGGGFELREVRIPIVGWKPRSAAAIGGVFFVLVGIGLHSIPPTSVQETTPRQSFREDLPASGAGARPQEGTLISAADPVEANEPSLISAIRLADDVEADALFTLNPSPLGGTYVGEALRREQNNIKTLKANGVYQANTLEGQVFESFKVSPDGTKAEVRVIETWSNVVYRIGTQTCVQMTPSHEYPQTIYLVRGKNGWMIENIVHDLVRNLLRYRANKAKQWTRSNDGFARVH